MLNLEDKLFNTYDFTEKEKIRKELLRIEKKFLQSNIDRQLEDAEQRLKNLKDELKKKTQPLSEGQKQKLQTSYQRKIEKAEDDIVVIQQKAQHLKELNLYEKPYFLWHLYFKHVFDNGGFDIVIANPPYGVKADDELYAGSGLGSKDSYGFFIMLAIDTLLKEEGTLVYIVSDTWLTIKSHLPLRQLILKNRLHKVIRLHADTFGAVVNTCIFSLSKVASGKDIEGTVLAADLTNLSTKKSLPEFREKLWHLNKYAGEYNERYAVYQYPQQLISTNSNRPIFTVSPKLFALMNDCTCYKEKKKIEEGTNEKEIEVRKIQLNDKEIKLVRFGDVADSPHGISTGNNKKYVRVEPKYDTAYLDIEDWMKVPEKRIAQLTEEEKLKGIDIDWKELKQCFVPFEKGGASEAEEGWLPNYFVPTKYYINWGKGSIKNMKINPGFRWINSEYFFRPGLSFSISGMYAPTFRLNSGAVFEAKGSGIFSSIFTQHQMLGILCSKISKFIFKNYVKHTVDTSGEDIANYPFPIITPVRIVEIVKNIIAKQEKEYHYNYFETEQKEIDQLVYQLYGLNEEDIQEVEYWWARRYPKLARFADTKPRLHLKDIQELEARLEETITRGENKYCEFKSSLRLDLRKGTPEKHIEHSALKNIAAFLNSEGGTLIIGIDDEKNILGLEATDYTTFSKGDKLDEWSKHFDNLVQNYLGNKVHAVITTQHIRVRDKTLAAIDVKKSPEPVWLKNGNNEEFYIRRTASAIQLSGREAVEYIKAHWK